MKDHPLTPREKKLGLILLALLALLAYTIKGRPSPQRLGLYQEEDPRTQEKSQEDAPIEERGSEIYVHITGAVKKPGLYKVKGPIRLVEVIDQAGGLTKDADSDQLNLAAQIEDQARIHVPSKGQKSEEGRTSPGKVNLNRASLEELQTLPGIGEKTAQKIKDRVEKEGPFQREEDLKDLPGIGEKKYQELEAYISVY